MQAPGLVFLCVVGLCLLGLGHAAVAPPAPPPMPAAKAPAQVRMWTAAKPCPMTQQFLGSRRAALAGREFYVEHGYPSMTQWQNALLPFADGVKQQAGLAAFAAGAGAAAHMTYLDTWAAANAATIRTLVKNCASNVAALGAAPFVSGQVLTVGSKLPAAVAGKIVVGANKPSACAELCAFAVATGVPAGAAAGQKSCSVAVGKGTGKANTAVRITLSGNVAQPGNLNLPPTSLVVGVGPAVTVSWPNTFVPKTAANYDSCTPIGAGTAKCKAPGVAGKRNGRAWSPKFEAAWWAAANVAAGSRYPNPDPPANGARIAAWTRRGACSEDKLIESFTAGATSVE